MNNGNFNVFTLNIQDSIIVVVVVVYLGGYTVW